MGGAPRLAGRSGLDAVGLLSLGPLPEATEPNAPIYLTYVAGVVLAVGLLVLGAGLVRGRRTERELA